MHPNQQTIEMFYGAFARLDPDTMARCYADDARVRRRGVLAARQARSDGHVAHAVRGDAGQGRRRVEARVSRRAGRRAAAARRIGTRTTASAQPAAWWTTASMRSSSSTRPARSCGTRTASISGAGRARPWARRACCWAGRRCCAARCAGSASANLQRFLKRDAGCEAGFDGCERRQAGSAHSTLTSRAARRFFSCSTAASLLSNRHRCCTARSMNFWSSGSLQVTAALAGASTMRACRSKPASTSARRQPLERQPRRDVRIGQHALELVAHGRRRQPAPGRRRSSPACSGCGRASSKTNRSSTMLVSSTSRRRILSRAGPSP